MTKKKVFILKVVLDEGQMTISRFGKINRNQFRKGTFEEFTLDVFWENPRYPEVKILLIFTTAY